MMDQKNLLIAIVLSVAILIGLGVWQLQRLKWKEALIATVSGHMTAPPVTLSGPAGPNIPMAMLLAKATIILLLALGMTVLMQRTSAGARHLVWLVTVAALLFVLSLDRQNAINFQLLGGIWILQTFPAIVIGLYTRWLHRWALLLGWAVAMVYGTWKAYGVASPATAHFGGSTANIGLIGQIGYIGLTAVVLNVVVAVVGTLALRAIKVPAGADVTDSDDYHADAGDPRVSDLPELV